MFLYEPLQALNVQNNPISFISFQPRDTPKLKGWSTSTKDMHQKQHKEIHAKSEKLRAIIVYFLSTLGTSIASPSD